MKRREVCVMSIARSVASVFIAFILCMSRIPSVAIADDSSAIDSQGSTTQVVNSGENIPSENSNNSDEAAKDTQENQVTSGSNKDSESDVNAFEFIYVDAKTVCLGETQKIVISFTDKSMASNSVLFYQQGDNSELKSVAPAKVEDGAALFELTFNSEEQLGTYSLVKIVTSGEDGKEIAINQDTEYGYSFSVVEKVSEDEDMTIYALDNSGELSDEAKVDSALNQAEESTPAAAALSARSVSRSNDLVIALDPGHGGSDPGAVNGSLVEKNLTLKIASYCRDALQDYSGVKVVMTRSSDEYVGLSDRVQRAVNAGANVFVSFHINATAGATGFEVWVQNDSSWRYYLHEESSDLGTAILEKLEKFGIKNRGNKESDSQNGTKYSDGSPADYLTVLYESRKNNIPAVLIEHGFIDGSAKDQALLSSESSLKQMGEADAEAIAEYYDLSNGISDLYDPSATFSKTLEDGEYVINSNLSGNKVLDVPSASSESGKKIQLYTSNGSDAQKFEINRDSKTGYYSIKNVNSQLLLGLEKNSDGTYKKYVVQQESDSSNNSQKWIIEKNSDGTFTIKNAINPNYAVDIAGASTANGTSVQMYASNGSSAQKYNFLSEPNVTGTKTISDGLYEITNTNSGKVLDIASGSNAAGANCQQYASNGTAAQKFSVTYDGEDFYTIVNLKSGKALEVESTALATSVNVRQGDLTSSDAQKWAIQDNGDGSYKLISKATGLVMDVASASTSNGANVDAYTDNGTAAQKFSFKSAKGEKVIAEGDYAITSKLATNKVLDIASASTSNGAKVQLYKANGTAAQSFHLSFDEATGFYTITNNNSGKVLDLPSAATSNGTKIQQYTSNGTLAQKWVITKTSDGSYQICSALDTKKCMDVASASTSNGAKIQLYSSNGTNAQKFLFETNKDPYLIMGTSDISASNLASHYVSVVGSAAYPAMVYSGKGASSINDFCQILVEEARTEGVRADVVYAQIMLETNYLRFGGDVSVSQCNFGGIGATGGGVKGATFADVRTGLRASVQHLKAYASTDSLVNQCVDPRFQYVKRGCAPSVYDLGNGNWATDPQYASKIISIMNAL